MRPIFFCIQRNLNRPRTSYETALHRAWCSRMQAWRDNNREREALIEQESQVSIHNSEDEQRRRLLALDPHGALQTARQMATHAFLLSVSHSEKRRSLELLALIECDLGHHEAARQVSEQLRVLRLQDSRDLNPYRQTIHGLTTDRSHELSALEDEKRFAKDR